MVVILQTYAMDTRLNQLFFMNTRSMRLQGLGQGLAYQATYLGFILVIILFTPKRNNFWQYFVAIIIYFIMINFYLIITHLPFVSLQL